MAALEEANVRTAARGAAAVSAAAADREGGYWADLSAATDPVVFARAWLAITGRSYPAIQQGTLYVAGEASALEPIALWSSEAVVPDVERLKRAGEAVLGEALSARSGTVARQGEDTYAAVPVLLDGEIAGLVLVEARIEAGIPPRRLLRHLQWSSAWVEAFLRRHRTVRGRDAAGRASLVVEAIEAVSARRRFVDASRVLAGLLATKFGCERVAIGVRHGLTTRLAAFSQSTDFERRAELVRAFEAAMDEAVDQEQALAAPPPAGTRALIAHAQEKLRSQLAVEAVLTLPIHHAGEAFGAVTLARRGGGFDQEDVDLLDAVVATAGTLLAEKRAGDLGFFAFLGKRAGDGLKVLLGPRMLAAKAAALLLAAGLTAATLVTDTVQVVATGQIHGESRRVASAPFDGYLKAQHARAGDVVSEGAVLAELEDDDLVLTRLRHLAERRQTQLELDRALARRELADVNIAQATLGQKDAEIALAEEMLERALIRAPFDGIVVSGDLSQSIGRPVSRGEALFELAPLDRYRVTLVVPETDIGAIRPGHPGQILLTALPEQPFPIEIVTVTPVAKVVEGVNGFEVLARLTATDPRIRPSMEGTAKIEAGEASLLWIWTHGFVDWLRLALWPYLP